MIRFNRPSHATIVAYVALFTALAGGAYAAQIAEKNSVISSSIQNGQVKSKDLKDNGVKSKDVKDGQLTDADMVANGLTGASISGLGDVDVTANGLTGASIDEATLLGVDAETVDGRNAECATGTQFFIGGCWDTVARGGLGYFAAAAACPAAGGELPSPTSLVAFNGEPGITLAATDEWTNVIETFDGVGPWETYSVVGVSNANDIKGSLSPVDLKGFRCVFPLVR